jgi:HK97 gp10 family phage protein
MTQNITVRIDRRRLTALLNGTGPRAKAVLDKTARDVEAGAKQRCPVDTGALRNSIHVEPPSDLFKRTIADGMEYGIYVEMGARGRPPKPFMAPALENVRRAFAQAWEALFR